MRHFKFLSCFTCFLVVFYCSDIFALDSSIDDRKRLVNRRNERFYKTKITRNYISGSGEYDSDEDNKQYVARFSHFYKSDKVVSDVEFHHQVDYAKGTKSRDNYEQIKTSELYRAILAEKIVLADTSNYFIFFNESKYDDMSRSFYYDFVTAAGFGRMFFDDRLEIDLAYGFNKVKDSNSTITPKDYNRDIWVPSLRTEFEIFNKIRVVERAFAYYSDGIDGYYVSTRFQYPLTQRVYLQLSHLFEKRVYEKYGTRGAPNRRVNEVDRQILIGFRYDLGRR